MSKLWLVLIFLCCACYERKPLILNYPEIEMTVSIELPFSQLNQQRVKFSSDYECADILSISISDSTFLFTESELGFFRSYPANYYGILIGHNPKQCYSTLEHKLDSIDMNEYLNRHLGRFKQLMPSSEPRVCEIINAQNTNFAAICMSEPLNGDSIQIMRAFNYLFDVKFINSKHDMTNEQFDSSAIQLLRSVRIN